MDDKGQFRDDNHMCFGDKVCADNDTRGPNNFIKEQNLIIGAAADEVADHINDAGHTAKNVSNKFYDIKGKDSSFGGAGMLENLRIKAIV